MMSLQNATNETEFSCSLSLLSSSAIADHEYWTLNPIISFGTPIVGVIKFMVTILLFVIGIFVMVTLIGRKTLRGFNDYPLLLNQTVTVLLHSLTLLLFGLVIEFSPQAEFVYGGSDSVRCGMCTFAGFLFILFNTVLLHTIAINFLVLYKKVVRVFGRQKLNRKTNIIIVILMWFISFWIAIAPVAGFGSYEFDSDFGICLPSHTGQSKTGVKNRVYIAFIFLEGIVPLGITIFACQATCRVALKHTKASYKGREVGGESLKRSQRLLEVFMSFLIFCILWVPLAVTALIIIAVPDLSNEVYIICWLLYLSNPLFQLIYTILQVRFRF